MTTVNHSNTEIRTLSNEIKVYGYVREIENQLIKYQQNAVIPKVIKDMIVQYSLCFTFDIYPSLARYFKLNEEDWNIMRILHTPATVKFGDYISCPDFSQTHSNLSKNMEKLRKEYFISTVIKIREINSDFVLNDHRFTNVSQCSSLSILPIFRAAFLLGMNSYWCGFGFAMRKFNTWNKTNNGRNGSCILFGDGLLRTSTVFDEPKEGGVISKMVHFCKEGDIVICEIDMNARIGRIFNEKGGESLIVTLPENEDICIVLYYAGSYGTVTVIDSGFV